MKKTITLLITIILISSCRDSSRVINQNIKLVSTTLGCENYLSITNDLGVFCNNVWNKDSAKDFAWKQCLEKKMINDTLRYGWSWQWPSKSNVIYAYPQIKIGRSPWAPAPFFNDRFPLKINSIPELNMSYDIETVTNGQHNLATTMWIVNSPLKIEQPDPSSIIAEFMIWTYATQKHFNPAGKKYGEVKIDDMEWEVWTDQNWSDQSGVNSNKWINISFRSKTNHLKVEFNVKKLIEYSIKENILPPDLYIADLELGNEIMSGSGYTWVKSFKVW